MKRHYMLTLILGAGALGVATFADQAHADKGITINEQSSTKALSSVGKSNSDTTVYTDTMGLTPQPEFKQIQDNPNFIVSEKSFPKPQPAMKPQPVQMRSGEMPETNPPVSEAREKFSFFDKSENGLLDQDEFFLFELSSDAQKIFERVDKNADNAISFREFEPYFKAKEG